MRTCHPRNTAPPGGARVPFLVVSLALLAAGCGKSPVTIVSHSPIYPAASQEGSQGDDVTYTLEKVSGSKLRKVELYETVSTVDDQGVITSSGFRSLLHSWAKPESRIDFTRAGGYPVNSLVQYEFVVKAPSSKWRWRWPNTETYTQGVSFATRPYPVPDDPAPVYVVGDPAQVFDIVLIPDTDITDMDAFRENCHGMIRDAFLDEPTTRSFRRAFNFYINPDPGTAIGFEQTSSLGTHKVPLNWANTDFAEGRVLMHEQDLWDYTVLSMRLYSTEMGNRGTILHESGHGLFGLADEYNGGRHWKGDPLPNNWDAKQDAEIDAPRRGKSASDASEIGAMPWYRLCNNACQMMNTGKNHSTYDRPCRDRVVWSVLDNAAP
jgi:hypothetical protein